MMSARQRIAADTEMERRRADPDDARVVDDIAQFAGDVEVRLSMPVMLTYKGSQRRFERGVQSVEPELAEALLAAAPGQVTALPEEDRQ